MIIVFTMHKIINRIVPFTLITIGAFSVALLYYYEILGYASIRVIRLSSYLIYEELFLLALIPITIPLWNYLRMRGKNDYTEAAPRKFLRMSFGILWVFDGVLQMQLPFLTLFVMYNLIPLLGSQPLVTFLVEHAIVIWNLNPPIFDVLASLVQVYIGVFFLIYSNGLRFKIAQYFAILWGLTIWIFGEGFGGIFPLSGATMLTGAPGSALFYSIASILLLAYGQPSSASKVIKITRITMIIAFFGFAITQALPSNGFWGSLPISFFPSPFNVLLNLTYITVFLNQHASFWNGIYVTVMLAGGAMWLVIPRYAPYLTIGWGLFIWYIYQGFGIFGTNASTDPNTGLPLILISWTALMITRSDYAVKHYLPSVSASG